MREVLDQIQLVQDKKKWGNVNLAMNFGAPETETLPIGWATISFQSRSTLHGASYISIRAQKCLMCYVWLPQHMAITYLNTINRFFCNRDAVCLLWNREWVFTSSWMNLSVSGRYYLILRWKQKVPQPTRRQMAGKLQCHGHRTIQLP